MEGIRHNQGKLRFDLVPSIFNQQVAEVFTFGAQKYAPDNWKYFTDEQQKEIIASLLRHINAYHAGVVFDEESGLPHLAHAAANIAMILYYADQNSKLNQGEQNAKEFKANSTH